MNTENLRPVQELNERLTPEQRTANATKAGIASGEARKRRRTLREIAELIGEGKTNLTMPDGTEEEMTNDVALVTKQYLKAILDGDTNAAKFILSLRGEEQVAAVSTTIYNVTADIAAKMQELENSDI